MHDVYDVTNNDEEGLRDRIKDVAPVASGHTHPVCEAGLGCSCGISRGVDREVNIRTSREKPTGEPAFEPLEGQAGI